MSGREKMGQVYFIETDDGQFVKIGYSQQVMVRLSQLGTLRPGSFSLRVIGSIPGTPAVERWLHGQFVDERDNGEWFRKTSRVCAFIESLGLTPPVIIERPARRRRVAKRHALRIEPEPVVEAEPEVEPEMARQSDPTEESSGSVAIHPKSPPWLTIPEKDRLFKVIKDVRDRAIFRLLYHHGLRATEIGKLDLAHFRQGTNLDLDRLYIYRLKGSISGECALVPSAAQALRVWVRKRGYTEGPLFPSRQRGRISRGRIFQLMRRYCAAAGIPLEKAHPHALKHTCCTHLLSDKKESIVDVQRHVGHASIKNTMIYAELTGEANAARAKRLREWK